MNGFNNRFATTEENIDKLKNKEKILRLNHGGKGWNVQEKNI